jgi:hypothetical protein
VGADPYDAGIDPATTPRADAVAGGSPSFGAPLPPEQELRERLGVPHDAAQVMIVAESTHWDPNWLLTSGEYFRLCVRRTLDRALDELVAEPRRVFSLECMFFPDLYWEERPERRELFRSLVDDGRLRFSGCGVTTPDTLLPEDELLLRDLLVGQEWLRTRGMTQEPRILYLPDSFGHSPGTPSLLAAAGVRYASVCRIDGMRFPGADLESARRFPRPGTSAEHLLQTGTADFVWRGPDGNDVLAHWMTYGYGHGDMLASGGLSRALGLPVSWPDRRERHVAARLEGFIQQLTALARTPYLLLAIGFDFVSPVPRLVDLLDRWNETDYSRTGVWLVNAGMDDYFDLVSHHRAALPTLSLDPNPYWMGFYSSRPALKARCRDLGRVLTETDNELVRAAVTHPASSHTSDQATRTQLSAAWWTAVASNHHDYVTGTAPDRVANGEQTRWLRSARAGVNAPEVPAGDGPRPAPPRTAHGDSASATWTRDGAQLRVTTGSIDAVFDERRGGTLVSLTDRFGAEQLRAPSLGLTSFTDSGGLWRMGQEFNGGRWTRRECSADHPASLDVATGADGSVRVVVHARLEGRPVEVVVEFLAHDPGIVVRTSVTARLRRTVTLDVHQITPVASLAMHQPGGMVVRDLTRWYEPTFWPLHSFGSALPAGDVDARAPTLTMAAAVPTALHATADGTIETVVARTAVKEIAFGAVPVLAPAWGRRWGTQSAALALSWSPVNDLPMSIRSGRHLQRIIDHAVGRRVPAWLIEVDDPLVDVLAVKHADRGHGYIVRLRNWSTEHATRVVRLTLPPGTDAVITEAWRADSRERDLARQRVLGGAAHVELDSYLTTIRLEIQPTGANSRC